MTTLRYLGRVPTPPYCPVQTFGPRVHTIQASDLAAVAYWRTQGLRLAVVSRLSPAWFPVPYKIAPAPHGRVSCWWGA